jgi:hypothetical protein
MLITYHYLTKEHAASITTHGSRWLTGKTGSNDEDLIRLGDIAPTKPATIAEMEEKESSDKKRRRSVVEVFDKERERVEKRMSFDNVDGAFEGGNATAVQTY